MNDEPTTTKDLLGRNRVNGLKNPNTGVNPKDRIGAAKVDFTLCPEVAYVEWALAQMDGATKYGPYNWRIEPIQARTYIVAAQRHLQSFLRSEQRASDSGVHHLGHAMACCSILMDAEAYGTLVDNRPVDDPLNPRDFIAEANEFIKKKPEGWGR